MKKPYTPLTGNACGCKRGVQRDNCPNCEGTGKEIDFRAIHAAKRGTPIVEALFRGVNKAMSDIRNEEGQ